MALTPTYTYGMRWLQPLYNDRNARMISVALAAGTYPAGQILGQTLTATATNDVQTLASTATGGTIGLTFPGYAWTDPPFGTSQSTTIAYNATLASVQAWLDSVFGAGNTLATGGPLPTSIVITFQGALAAHPMPVFTVNNANATGGTATITHTTTGIAPSQNYGAYPGTSPAKGILKYPCTVDASGNITISQNVPGLTDKGIPMYYAGTFRTEDLVGLDATAITNLGAVLVAGNTVSGILHFG